MIGKKTPARPVAIRGLSPQEVEKSRKTHGSNELTQKKRNGFLKQFLASFGDPIIKILLAALAINVIFLFRDSTGTKQRALRWRFFWPPLSRPIGIRKRIGVYQATGRRAENPMPGQTPGWHPFGAHGGNRGG